MAAMQFYSIPVITCDHSVLLIILWSVSLNIQRKELYIGLVDFCFLFARRSLLMGVLL